MGRFRWRVTLSAEEIEASIGRDEEVACTALSAHALAARSTWRRRARRARRLASRVADLDELASRSCSTRRWSSALALPYLLLTSEDTGGTWLHSHRHVPADIRLCLARWRRGAPLLDEWAASSGRVQVTRRCALARSGSVHDARALARGPTHRARSRCPSASAIAALASSFCLPRPTLAPSSISARSPRSSRSAWTAPAAREERADLRTAWPRSSDARVT